MKPMIKLAVAPAVLALSLLSVNAFAKSPQQSNISLMNPNLSNTTLLSYYSYRHRHRYCFWTSRHRARWLTRYRRCWIRYCRHYWRYGYRRVGCAVCCRRGYRY